ncbi:MAG TPA: fumarylacetoacetate hydrolase family protein [Burkholderiaceae bacterium]|nr:fumarylacetoacetate hydrolase family protein [Burkholderiaceae bacterium]
MKLATYRDGSRDGQLVVVSRDLTQAHYATHVAHTLQQVLDDWNFVSPQLEDLSRELNHGKARHVFPFDPAQCLAPLPRTSQCVRAHAVAPAPTRNRGGVADLLTLPGDALLGARADLPLADVADGLDFEAGWAVLCSDLPQGCAPARALEGVRLLTLANTWVLREVQARERAAQVGEVQSRPAVTLGPVVVTPDELGGAWASGRVSLTLEVLLNGRRVVQGQADQAQAQHAGQWLAALAARRPVRAGAVVCSGPLLTPTGGPAGGLQPGDCLRVTLTAADGSQPLGTMDTEVRTLHEADDQRVADDLG